MLSTFPFRSLPRVHASPLRKLKLTVLYEYTSIQTHGILAQRIKRCYEISFFSLNCNFKANCQKKTKTFQIIIPLGGKLDHWHITLVGCSTRIWTHLLIARSDACDPMSTIHCQCGGRKVKQKGRQGGRKCFFASENRIWRLRDSSWLVCFSFLPVVFYLLLGDPDSGQKRQQDQGRGGPAQVKPWKREKWHHERDNAKI